MPKVPVHRLSFRANKAAVLTNRFDCGSFLAGASPLWFTFVERWIEGIKVFAVKFIGQ